MIFSKRANINIILGLFFIFISCNENKQSKSIKKIPVEFSIERFEKDFFDTPTKNLSQLKKQYPFLFPKQYHDSVWINRKKDSFQIILYENVKEKFKSINYLKKDIKTLFQHIFYYFPETPTPRIITLQNDLDYQNPIIYNDSLLLISLDCYLGIKNDFYTTIPKYIKRKMEIEYISADIVDEFSKYHIPPPNNRTLLAEMIFYGKKLYLKDILLPKKHDTIILGYTEKKLKWAKNNEKFIWQYFLQNELLYKNNPSYKKRFTQVAPFSKFYLSIDNESPGRIGQWLGLQIVRSFVKRNKKNSLKRLLNTPSERIFRESKYKPQ